jgi:rare lipoprotein A
LMNTSLTFVAIAILYLLSPCVSDQNCYAQPEASTMRESSASNPSGPAATPAVGTTIVGKASWYGPGLQGHRTATGERFDPNETTAATKQLPLNSHAVVTNLDNGRAVKVRINDCGPVPPGRKIDLSKKAAQKINMTRKGTAPVAIKVVDSPPHAITCAAKSR